jgi:hypothetical protein
LVTAQRPTQPLVTHRVETDPSSDDPRLLGRTYAIPFDAVWRGCIKLVQARNRWSLLQADDLVGFIRIRCTTMVFRFEDDLEIRIVLDENALTRVDVRSRPHKARAVGLNTRRVGRFFKRLDRALGASPEKILDPREASRLTRQA